MEWKIVADSSSDLTGGMPCAPGVDFATVPLKLRLGKKEFVDEAGLDPLAMLAEMQQSSEATSSACPSPDEWAAQFRQAECSIGITITSGLSGSYNSAMVAREMVLEESPGKKIHIIDSLSTGGTMVLLARKVNELIAQGLSFEEVRDRAEEYRKEMRILFCLSSFDNLIRNGRMNKLVGTLASALSIRAIGQASAKGTIELIHKARGQARALAVMVEEMVAHKDLTGKPVVISHCDNLAAAEALQKLIEATFQRVQVTIMPTGGLTSYYAEKYGIIVGY